MPDHYLTIERETEGLFKDRGSKFLAFAYPVSSEDEIKQIVETVRKKYHDARHHCYAWVLGAEGSVYRANDDGEPSSTAGKPILTQIQSYELTNVLVIVVRYFGGILLGTGGLINAYRNSAQDALEKAQFIKKYLQSIYEIKFPYSEMNPVMKILKEMNANQSEQIFELNCSLKANICKAKKALFEESLRNLEGVELKLIKED